MLLSAQLDLPLGHLLALLHQSAQVARAALVRTEALVSFQVHRVAVVSTAGALWCSRFDRCLCHDGGGGGGGGVFGFFFSCGGVGVG